MKQINMAEQRFISEDDFIACVAKQKNTLKWRELEAGRIYCITRMKMVQTKFGQAGVLTMCNIANPVELQVWAPQRLVHELQLEELPRYVRPLGKRQCQCNPSQSYHAYELV